jgi:hypothetical protein
MKRVVTMTALVLLNEAAGHAQARSGEVGRGFPYSSGESWTPGPWILILVLGIAVAIAFAVKDKLRDQPRWHTWMFVAAVLATAVALAARFSRPYPVELGLIVFLLIPSVAAIGVLYLVLTGLRRKG